MGSHEAPCHEGCGRGASTHEENEGYEGDEEEKGNEGHGCYEGHEGDEEEEGHEGHGCHEGHEGHEGDEEEEGHEGNGSYEGHEGHEGHEVITLYQLAAAMKRCAMKANTLVPMKGMLSL